LNTIQLTARGELIIFEGQYKTAHDALVKEVSQLREMVVTGTSRDKGIGLSWTVLVAVVMMIGTLITVYAWIQKGSGNTVPTVTPQVVYVPAPAGTPK
jgi:hypothetical protein